MNLQLALTLIAATIGFIASLWFAGGTAFTNTKKLASMSRAYIGFNLVFAQATVAQAAQYLIGSLLLVVSFFLQVLATLTNPATPLYPWLSSLSSVGLIFSTLLPCAGLAYCCYRWLYKWRMPKVEQELRDKK